TQGVTIGVSAPSEQLIGIGPSGDIDPWRGTSGAAPNVAGIAALVQSAHPDLGAGNDINRIVATAELAPLQDGEHDPIYGYGIIDAAGAVSDEVPLVSEQPADDLKEWIRLNRGASSPGGTQIGPSPTPE